MKVTKEWKRSLVEYCPICGKTILDDSHDEQCYEDCIEEELGEGNYSDRLAYGFDLLNMEE